MGLVAKIQQIITLSPEGVSWLQENIKTFSFKKNDKVLLEGKICNYLYYVNAGMMGGYFTVGDKEVCNWIAIEKDFATSYYSFINRKPSYETIECFENTTLQALHINGLNELFMRFPESERAGRLIHEEYYSRLEERLISFQFTSARERYESLLKNRPEIIHRAPLGRIATYLGMKQETLSRIRAEIRG